MTKAFQLFQFQLSFWNAASLHKILNYLYINNIYIHIGIVPFQFFNWNWNNWNAAAT